MYCEVCLLNAWRIVEIMDRWVVNFVIDLDNGIMYTRDFLAVKFTV